MGGAGDRHIAAARPRMGPRAAGLGAAAPGFGRVDFRPLLDPRLGSGRASHDTAHGRVASTWGVGAQGRAWVELELPDGLEAVVSLPGQAAQAVVGGRHRFVR